MVEPAAMSIHFGDAVESAEIVGGEVGVAVVGDPLVVLLLAPGEYEYKFVRDDEWMTDEGNPNFAANDFGTLNSVMKVE